jgi:uncharacterized protein (TIGR03118 family)
MNRHQSIIQNLKSVQFLTALIACLGIAAAARAESFATKNLATDNQAVNPAQITDPDLINAWGISYSSTSAFWVSANGSGTARLYTVDPVTNATTKLGLEVTIPGDGSVTGQVFNGNSKAFNGNLFMFVSEDGTVSGWRGSLGSSAETLVAGSSANVYKGTTEATINGNTYLYAANFRAGKIDVIKGISGAPNLTGNFTDPGIPSGYAPFNIQKLGDKLYVTYAVQDSDKHDDVAGLGHGFVSVFDTQGKFLSRIGTQGTLNSPWGLAIAPTSFGKFAGDLLVGNFGDGRINVFNLATDSFVAQLAGTNGKPLLIDGLWDLTIGNDHGAGSSQKLYFSAGPSGEQHGLFGVINSVPEPSSAILGLVAAGLVAACHLRIRNNAVST